MTRKKRKNKKKNGSCPKCGRNNGNSIEKKKKVKQSRKKTIRKSRPESPRNKEKKSKPVRSPDKNSLGNHKRAPGGKPKGRGKLVKEGSGRTNNVERQNAKKKRGNVRKGRGGKN